MGPDACAGHPGPVVGSDRGGGQAAILPAMGTLATGSATAAGTARFRERFGPRAGEGHFRRLGDLWLSSLGLGTYLGETDRRDDDLYTRAVVRVLEGGVNVLDSAINYRCQRSERNIGRALEGALDTGVIRRDEVVVATKGGFLPFDGSRPSDARSYFRSRFVDTGVIRPGELVAGCHCMTPRYLEHQIEQSRQNLGLETIDIYYLHNPETQLEEVPRDEFLERLRDAFATLEAACDRGAIGCYGVATWSGLRQQPDAPDHLALADLLAAARAAAGGSPPRFAVVQLPFNLSMREAATRSTQSSATGPVPLLRAAADAGLYVMSSASIMQGRLSGRLPAAAEALAAGGLETAAQRAIQFVRSTPGLGTALVGMKETAHIAENLRVVAAPVATADTLRPLLS
jgi:aryl-alcohol dehydrogenase-like predicted oxidoreductase